MFVCRSAFGIPITMTRELSVICMLQCKLFRYAAWDAAEKLSRYPREPDNYGSSLYLKQRREPGYRPLRCPRPIFLARFERASAYFGATIG